MQKKTTCLFVFMQTVRILRYSIVFVSFKLLMF